MDTTYSEICGFVFLTHPSHHAFSLNSKGSKLLHFHFFPDIDKSMIYNIYFFQIISFKTKGDISLQNWQPAFSCKKMVIEVLGDKLLPLKA